MSKSITVLILALVLLSSGVLAQPNTLQRQYVPVVIDGEKFPMMDFPIENHYYAYKFDAASRTWTAIPFQFDEVDENGLFVLKGDSLYDGLVDSADQLIFMPENIGDRALTSDWLEDAGAQNATRIEIELTEAADPGKKGWIYLFKGLTTPPSMANVVDYVSAPGIDTASDTIKTAHYTLGHNTKGWMDYAMIRGTEEKDILDRVKLHLRGQLDLGDLGKFPYNVNEEANLDSPKVRFQNGPVRAFRKYEVKFVFPLIDESFSYIMSYSPFSTFIGTQGINLADSTIKEYLPLLGLRTLRQSVDLSENAKGMRFYSPGNPQGVLIDGMPDVVNDQIVLSPEHAWMMASGSNGSLVSMIQVPLIGDRQSLYFYDDTGNLAIPDSTTDTGDNQSIGDMGVFFTIGDSLEGLVFSIDLSFYLLPSTDDPMLLGENLKKWVDEPLAVQMIEQSKTPTSVADLGELPSVFGLYDAYPNPYHAAFGKTKFRFTTGANTGKAILRIYNTIGQEVMRFEQYQTRALGAAAEFSWDGRDFAGRPLPAGIYLYQLEFNNRIDTRKLLLLR